MYTYQSPATAYDRGPEPDASLRKRILYVIDGPERRERVKLAHTAELEQYAAEVNLRRRTSREEHWP